MFIKYALSILVCTTMIFCAEIPTKGGPERSSAPFCMYTQQEEAAAVAFLSASRAHRIALRAGDEKAEKKAQKDMRAILRNPQVNPMNVLKKSEDLAIEDQDGATISDIKLMRELTMLNYPEALAQAKVDLNIWKDWKIRSLMGGFFALGSVVTYALMKAFGGSGIETQLIPVIRGLTTVIEGNTTVLQQGLPQATGSGK